MAGRSPHGTCLSSRRRRGAGARKPSSSLQGARKTFTQRQPKKVTTLPLSLWRKAN